MTITLYYAPFTRATRPRWLLEELGVPHELKVIDLRAGEHKSSQYIDSVHPHGAVPALTMDGETMIESGAMLAFLADRFAEKGLAPPVNHQERAKYLEWLFYGYATFEPALVAFTSHNPSGYNYLGAALPEREAKDRARCQEVINRVEGALGRSEWLLSTFSAADVLIASLLQWAASMKLCDGRPAIAAYLERCKARPAFQRSRKS